MLARIGKDTGIDPSLKPRLDNEAIMTTIKSRTAKGGLTGDVLLYLLQTHREFGHASLNLVLEIVHAAIPRWEQPMGAEWHRQKGAGRLNHDRQAVLTNFRQFLPVAHLWAAHGVAETEGFAHMRPNSNATLPEFLGLAEAIARACEGIYLQKPTAPGSRHKPAVLPPAKLWRFAVPPAARRDLTLNIPLLHPAARDIAERYLG